MDDFWAGFRKQADVGRMLARGALRAGKAIGHYSAPFTKSVGMNAPAAAKGTGLGAAFSRGFSGARQAAGKRQIASATSAIKNVGKGALLGAGGMYAMSGDGQTQQQPNMYY